jgi:fluoroacetyl-CoA thioesterase
MKSGLTKGFAQEVKVTVTPDMFPNFDGSAIHPLYSTSTMVRHMEFAARKVILPFLEEHEEGMGISVDVQHLHPVPEGKEVTCIATFQEMIGKRILCDVQVKCGSRLVGRGFVTQAILPKEDIQKNITQAQNDL